MLEIEMLSAAGKYLEKMLTLDTYMIRFDVRRDGVAIKRNEGMWTETLPTTVPKPYDVGTAVVYNGSCLSCEGNLYVIVDRVADNSSLSDDGYRYTLDNGMKEERLSNVRSQSIKKFTY